MKQQQQQQQLNNKSLVTGNRNNIEIFLYIGQALYNKYY